VLYLLVDTSAWLDVARRRDGQKWIVPIRVLCHQGQLELLVPAVVVDEYERNRARIEAAMTASVNERFRLLRQDLSEYGGAGSATSVELIRGLQHQVPLISAMTTRNFDEIAELLARGRRLVPSPEEYQQVVERGLEKRAPLHLDRNNVADALLVEMYGSAMRSGGREDVFCFVTSNTRDFSAQDERHPHPDLAELFDNVDRSRYYKGVEGLALALRDYFGEEFDELVEESDFEEEPRQLVEILEAEAEFFERVSFQRAINREARQRGNEPWTFDELRETVGARRKAVLDHYGGVDMFGPYSDFEWGMINGKLSALRWVLGSEWDFLDT
jgi:hypothetical protein